jgi:hypothetical protein
MMLGHPRIRRYSTASDNPTGAENQQRDPKADRVQRLHGERQELAMVQSDPCSDAGSWQETSQPAHECE